MKKIIISTALLILTQILVAQTIVNFNSSTLKSLVKSDLGITSDTVFASDMANLITFKHNYHGLNDLTGLEHAVNLEEIDLNHNSILDLDPISNLSKLKVLYLDYNEIVSLPDLSGLIRLEELSLGVNQIEDISGLSNTVTLKYLNLSVNKLDKYDFPSLYNLDNLRPIFWLKSNGPGFSREVIASLTNELEKIPLNPDSIKWDLIRTDIPINSDVRIRGAIIDTIGEGIYQLTEDVFLQYRTSSSYDTWIDYLHFNGTVKIDKSDVVPEISGSGSVYAFGNLLSNGGFNYAINGAGLEVKIPGSDDLDGFSLTTGKLYLSHSGTEVFMVDQQFGFSNMPFPLDKIFKYLNDQNSDPDNEYVNFGVYGSKRYKYDRSAPSNTTSYTFNFNSDGTYSFGSFAIKEPKVFYNGNDGKMGGSFKVKIPGSGFVNLGSEKSESIPVIIKNKKGELIGSTTFDNILKKENGRYFGSDFLELGMEIEFLNGDIDKLVLSISTDIPIGTSGLKITSMSGELESISSDMKIGAKVDIATSVEAPGFGPVVELTDFGVKIAPLYSFEGSGVFKMFGYQCANGSLKYNSKLNAISLHGDLNLGNILVGKVKSTLNGSSFTGVFNATLKTPSDLPWKLKFLSNKTIAAVTATLENEVISSFMYYKDFSIGQKIVLGKSEFPYFNYYLGTNLDNLYQIFKDGSHQFQIPENTRQVLIVVGNDMNLFDFSVTNPIGLEFSKSNTLYEQFDDVLQTTMLIKSPEAGTWTLNTDQSGDIRVEVMSENPAPIGHFIEPAVAGSSSLRIVYDIKDIGDTITVKFHYDTDKQGFDGVQDYWNGYPQQWTVIGEKLIDFGISYSDWFRYDLQDGEYFIYASIDDGKNPVFYQYAPGSFVVNWGEFYSKPEDLIAEITNDTIVVSWSAPTDSTVLMTNVYYKAVDSDLVNQKNIYDTNAIYLDNIIKGKEYEIWASFINLKNYVGPNSDTISTYLKDTINNNPPYFTTDPNALWSCTVGNTANYQLEAFDADGDPLTFALLNDTLGITLNENRLSWTPNDEQVGVFQLLLTVSDASNAVDSLFANVVVYDRGYFDIKLEFGSSALKSNNRAPIILRNPSTATQTQDVFITNLRTSVTDTIRCMKSSALEYTGSIYLHSDPSASELNVVQDDTLVISYSYENVQYADSAIFEPSTATGLFFIEYANIGFTVYPNISNGMFVLRFNQSYEGELKINVFDLSGKVVYERYLHSETELVINLSHFENGMYFINASNNKGGETQKLIIRK